MKKNILIFGIVLILLSCSVLGNFYIGSGTGTGSYAIGNPSGTRYREIMLVNESAISYPTLVNKVSIRIAQVSGTISGINVTVCEMTGSTTYDCSIKHAIGWNDSVANGNVIVNFTLNQSINLSRKAFMFSTRTESEAGGNSVNINSSGGGIYNNGTLGYASTPYTTLVADTGEDAIMVFYDVTTPQFQLTLKNAYNNSAITNFTAQISNTTLNQNITTNNGTIYWNVGQFINISIFNITGAEGEYFNNSIYNQNSSSDLISYAYLIDYEPPVITTFGFVNETNFNTTQTLEFSCYDLVAPFLQETVFFNGVLVYNSNVTNGSINTALVNISPSINTASILCSDFRYNATRNITTTAKTVLLQFINEVDKTAFDFSNLTTARLYYNETNYINLKTLNISNYTYMNNSKIWLEYSNDFYLILRYFDLDLFENNLKMCVNTHTTEQIQSTVISASESVVKIRNVFSDCYIVGDYTRFAYQDALSLRFFTIDGIYELKTLDGTEEIILAYIDGGLSTYYNLDTLIFNQNAYSFNILGSTFTAAMASPDLMRIEYRNPDADNSQSYLRIYDLNTSVLLYTATPATPNEWEVLFNYTTIGFTATENTIFKVVVVEEKTSGETEHQVLFVGANGGTGALPNGVAFGFAIILLILSTGGLSFGLAFGLVGILLDIGALIICSQSPGSDAITMLQVIILLALVFKVILISRTGRDL